MMLPMDDSCVTKVHAKQIANPTEPFLDEVRTLAGLIIQNTGPYSKSERSIWLAHLLELSGELLVPHLGVEMQQHCILLGKGALFPVEVEAHWQVGQLAQTSSTLNEHCQVTYRTQ